ncbi:amidase [Leucobacter ruminantium]|uniref:Amidase domain-containing protein n=1 Tax=Leucobacter ruminantium TaxID=1289170 RepID=A0A939RVB8_9MICO|nr:amidase family protein [Leucobacter ruminantium]MBO1803797.1 hypothetical protein [Leucobacter ruminantium]
MTHTPSVPEALRPGDLADLPGRIVKTLDYAETVGAATSAFSVLDREGAVAAAERIAQGDHSSATEQPLLGVAVTVKDSLHVPGLPRWHGSATHPGEISTTKSVPVRRLEEAGAIIVGKTAMPDYGLLGAGVSSQYGIIRNPWDLSKNPGGSSSGAGVCVAAGVTPLSIGTDIAGSVRLPAAACGISALKPTQGSLGYAPASTWRSAGPMARTIAEVRALYRVVAGPHVEDQLSLSTDPIESAVDLPLQGLRAGVIEYPGYGIGMDDETGRLFEQTLATLSSLGVELTRIDPGLRDEDFAALDRCLMARCLSELATCEEEARDRLLPEIRRWVEPGRSFSSETYYTDFEHLSATASRLATIYDEFDVIFSPVLGNHQFAAEDFAPDTSQALLYHTSYTLWYNQTGQPAVSMPMGLSTEGNPVALQIAAPRFRDYTLLNVAEAVERVLDLGLSYPDLSSR